MNPVNWNPDSTPIASVVILVAAVGWLLSRVRRAHPRSRTLGALAAACGFAAFIPALIGPAFKDPGQALALAACGLLTLLLAAAAVGLACGAFRARRRDRAVGVAHPALGLLCGVANLFCGAGLFVAGARAPTAGPGGPDLAEGAPPTWRSDAHGFEVAIPSADWAATPNPNVLAAFAGSRPPCMAIVAEARPARTEAEYEAALAFGRTVRDGTPTTDATERPGPNRHGHPHWAYAGWQQGPQGPYYFGVSVTRVRGKAVILMFEGQGRLRSEAGRAQEAQALRSQADHFLDSVN